LLGSSFFFFFLYLLFGFGFVVFVIPFTNHELLQQYLHSYSDIHSYMLCYNLYFHKLLVVYYYGIKESKSNRIKQTCRFVCLTPKSK
jgi:hypothetical protein